MKTLFRLFAIAFLFTLSPAKASDLKLVTVAEDVYAIVGPITNRTPENLGNNATFGFVVTDEGVVLIDSGGTRKGAQKIHEVIRSVTQQPVKYVINSGGQDHRWFGNEYFSDQGATIISSSAAREDHEARFATQTDRLIMLSGGDAYSGTRAKYADVIFDDKKVLFVGGVKFEIIHAGQAHTPGDVFVWLEDRSVMFTGDIVYVERMLGVMDHSNSKSWIEAFNSMASYKPVHVVPGHGNPVSLAVAEKDTWEYLTMLREGVAAFIDDGGDASEISKVDQSKFSYLFNFDTLSGRNALQVFTEMEWE